MIPKFRVFDRGWKLTFEEAKRWLNRAYKEESYIQSLLEERDLIRDRMLSISSIDYSKDRVQVSSENEGAFIKDVSKVDLLDRKLLSIIEKQSKIKFEILEIIDNLDNTLMKNILVLRHIKFLEWQDISDEVNYGRSRCHYYYNQAVNEICYMLDEKDRTHEDTDLWYCNIVKV